MCASARIFRNADVRLWPSNYRSNLRVGNGDGVGKDKEFMKRFFFYWDRTCKYIS